MRGLVLLLVVVVTVVIAAPRQKHLTPEAKACHDLLDPFETNDTEKTTMDKCILEQTGLQAILDQLKSAAGTTHSPETTHRPGTTHRPRTTHSPGTTHSPKTPHSPGTTHSPGHEEEGRKGSPIDLLQKAGKTAELAKLNECIARVNGHLLVTADGTASFDVAKFIGEVTAKVAGTTSQANTKLGLDNCPTNYLLSYNVHDYMECVEAYCATGAAPVPQSAEVTVLG